MLRQNKLDAQCGEHCKQGRNIRVSDGIWTVMEIDLSQLDDKAEPKKGDRFIFLAHPRLRG